MVVRIVVIQIFFLCFFWQDTWRDALALKNGAAKPRHGIALALATLCVVSIDFLGGEGHRSISDLAGARGGQGGRARGHTGRPPARPATLCARST